MAATFLSRQKARDLARAAIEKLSIPASTGAAGTFQNPIKSKLLAEVDGAFPGPGLTRAGHLIDFIKTADRLRTVQYTTAAAGSYEDPAKNLSRRAAALLPKPEANVRPDTARKVFALLTTAVFS